MSLLDLLISSITAVKDYLESLKAEPPAAVRPLIPVPDHVSFLVPYFNYEVVVPTMLAARLSRRSILVSVYVFLFALFVRLVQVLVRSLRSRRQGNRLDYKPLDDTTREERDAVSSRSPSPAAAKPLPIHSIHDLVTASSAILGQEGQEKVLQGQDGRLYVAKQSQRFLHVWDADERGNPIISREGSLGPGGGPVVTTAEVEKEAAEECEQLLRHFSEREITTALARQPSESNTFSLLPMGDAVNGRKSD